MKAFNRVTAMGQLAASISHEVIQPITAGINNAEAALHWLRAQPPNLDGVREALGEAVKEGNRAVDVRPNPCSHREDATAQRWLRC